MVFLQAMVLLVVSLQEMVLIMVFLLVAVLKMAFLLVVVLIMVFPQSGPPPEVPRRARITPNAPRWAIASKIPLPNIQTLLVWFVEWIVLPIQLRVKWSMVISSACIVAVRVLLLVVVHKMRATVARRLANTSLVKNVLTSAWDVAIHACRIILVMARNACTLNPSWFAKVSAWEAHWGANRHLKVCKVAWNFILARRESAWSAEAIALSLSPATIVTAA